MSREEMRQYAKEYRAEGFGRIADKKYRDKNEEVLREKARLRMRRLKLSRNAQSVLE